MKKIVLKLISFKLFGSLLGLLYSLLQVRYFGANALVDAYFVSTTAVYIITSLVQGGQLAEVFLPEYIKVKKEQSAVRAHLLFSVIVNRLLFIVLIGLILVYFLAPWAMKFLGPGLNPDAFELSISLFRVSLLLILFTLFSSFVNTVLNAEQVFGRAEFTGILSSSVSLVLLYFFHGQFGIRILLYSMLIGKVLEFITGIWFMRKAGLAYTLAFKIDDYDLTSFFKILVSTTGYVISTQFYTSVLTAMSTFLPAGTFSIYNYTKQLSTTASIILIGPASTVFFSKFTNQLALGRNKLAAQLEKPLMFMFLMASFLFLGVFFLGKEALMLLWSKRSLEPSAFMLAYIMLCLNFFGIIFHAAGAIFRKSAVGLGLGKLQYKYWMLVQLFSALVAWILIFVFKETGLIFIILINMLLIAFTSYFVAVQADGMNGIFIFGNAMKRKGFLLIWVFLFAAVYGLNKIIEGYYLDLIPQILLKISLGFIFIGLVFLVFRKRIFDFYRLNFK
jgi:putative peptidoglycan lipid II flippase